MSRDDQIKKLEELRYEVLMGTICKIDGQQNEIYIGELTEQGEIIPKYSKGNLEALKFSVELKEICKKEGWTYLENKERLNLALKFLDTQEEEIRNIRKSLLED